MAIEFVGFTADCRIAGSIPLADDRLSDMLNSVARVVIRGARIEDLIEGASAGPFELPIPCGEFLVIAGTGRRGVESRRRRTLRRGVKIGLGRYVVTGFLHVAPSAHAASERGSADALLAGRDLLVPLTEARLTYDRRDDSVEEAWDALLVNRARASWIDLLDDEPPTLSEEPLEELPSQARARYVKDFTGSVAD